MPCNYLLHRRQQVTIATSSTLSVISGVPQGSVLGPLLFLVYIDSITKVTLSRESQLVLFADDMSLSKPVVYPDDLSDLQSDVDLIYSWATQNYLTFNARKCKYMLLSRKRYRVLSSVTFNLQLGPNELERVSYLGVIVTDEHISHMCAKAGRLIGLFFLCAKAWRLIGLFFLCAKARRLIGLFFLCAKARRADWSVFSALCKISHTNCSYKSIDSSSP